MGAGAPGTFTLVGAMLLVQILGTAAYLTPAVVVVEAAATFDLSPGLIGVFIACVFASAAVSTLVSGRVVVALGPVRVLQVCLTLQAVGVLLLLSAVPALALVSSLLIGAGYGPSTPVASHLLARHTPARRQGLLFSIRQTGVPLAGVLIGFTVPPLTASFGWTASLASVAGLCGTFALGLGVLRVRLDKAMVSPVEGTDSAGTGLAAVVRATFADTRLRGVVIVSFLFAVVQLSFAGFLVLTLRVGAEISLLDAGMIMACANAAGIVGRVFWGWLADRISRAVPILLALGLVMGVACLGFSALRPGLPMSLLVSLGIVAGISSTGWNGVYLAEVARLAGGRSVASVTGGALFVTYLGSVSGPLLFGLLVLLRGSETAAFGALGVITIALVAAWRSSLSGPRPDPGTRPQ